MVLVWIWFICIGFIACTFLVVVGYMIGVKHWKPKYCELQYEIQRRDAIEATVDVAQKYRVRTAESDPNRQTKVKTGRLRAAKYKTPERRH